MSEILPDTEGWNAVRSLELTAEGIFLTVFPLREEWREEFFFFIKKELTGRGLEEIGWGEVERAFRRQCAKMKIAPPQPLSKNGLVLIELSPDEMEAYAYAFPPLDDGTPLTLGQIYAAIEKAGVNYGLDEEAIRSLIGMRYPQARIIARGKAAREGRDATIEYCVPISRPFLRPKELESGRVDFYDLNLIYNVNKGQVLARKTPPVPGEQGVTVTGKAIRPRLCKDIPLLPGKNTEVIDEGYTLVAQTPGHPVLEGGRIHVLPVYTVAGDVDFSTGNIDFIGSVHINGSVKMGFLVQAAGDVEVRQAIEGGIIKAGGNVYVKEGIRGIGKGRISAGGSVYARYLENAYVEAGQDVIIGESVMQSTISAGEKVIVKGKSGQLVGGFCYAGRGIEARNVGSQLGVATVLQVGVKPDLMAAMKSVNQKEAEVKTHLEKIKNTLQLLPNVQAFKERKSSVKEKILMHSLREAQHRLQRQLQEIKAEKEELSKKIKSLSEGRVKVQDCIYPGVTIKIGELSYYVRDKMQHVVFMQEGDEITIRPYC